MIRDESLEEIANLVKQRNQVDTEISKIIQRPAKEGHIGEFIASRIFDIALHNDATKKGSDGIFNAGPLRGKSVNVKLYGKYEGILDLNMTDDPPDYYLILAGPKSSAESSRGKSRPILIQHVFLFETKTLHDTLKRRGVAMGIATSVRKDDWHEAEIYPIQNSRTLILSDEQRRLLSLFS